MLTKLIAILLCFMLPFQGIAQANVNMLSSHYENSTLIPEMRFLRADFQTIWTAVNLCKYIEKTADIASLGSVGEFLSVIRKKTFASSDIAASQQEIETELNSRKFEIFIKIPKEGICVRYYDPTQTAALPNSLYTDSLGVVIVKDKLLHKQILPLNKVDFKNKSEVYVASIENNDEEFSLLPVEEGPSEELQDKNSKGYIMQGEKAEEIMINNLNDGYYEDITESEQIQEYITEIKKRLSANSESLPSDIADLRIVQTNTVVVDENDFCFGFYSHNDSTIKKFNKLFNDKDAHKKIFENPTLVLSKDILSFPSKRLEIVEYLYHEMICREKDHEVAIKKQQLLFPENYTEGDFDEREDANNSKIILKYITENPSKLFKGSLGELLRKNINAPRVEGDMTREIFLDPNKDPLEIIIQNVNSGSYVDITEDNIYFKLKSMILPALIETLDLDVKPAFSLESVKIILTKAAVTSKGKMTTGFYSEGKLIKGKIADICNMKNINNPFKDGPVLVLTEESLYGIEFPVIIEYLFNTIRTSYDDENIVTEYRQKKFPTHYEDKGVDSITLPGSSMKFERNNPLALYRGQLGSLQKNIMLDGITRLIAGISKDTDEQISKKDLSKAKDSLAIAAVVLINTLDNPKNSKYLTKNNIKRQSQNLIEKHIKLVAAYIENQKLKDAEDIVEKTKVLIDISGNVISIEEYSKKIEELCIQISASKEDTSNVGEDIPEDSESQEIDDIDPFYLMLDQITEGKYENVTDEAQFQKLIKEIKEIFTRFGIDNLEGINLQIYLTDTIVLSSQNTAVGFYTHDPYGGVEKLTDILGSSEAFDNIFPAPTLVLSKEVFDRKIKSMNLEFVYYILRAAFEGLEQATCERQKLFPDNYKKGTFLIRNDYKYEKNSPSALYQGELGRFLDEIITEKLYNSLVSYCDTFDQEINDKKFKNAEEALLSAENILQDIFENMDISALNSYTKIKEVFYKTLKRYCELSYKYVDDEDFLSAREILAKAEKLVKTHQNVESLEGISLEIDNAYMNLVYAQIEDTLEEKNSVIEKWTDADDPFSVMVQKIVNGTNGKEYEDVTKIEYIQSIIDKIKVNFMDRNIKVINNKNIRVLLTTAVVLSSGDSCFGLYTDGSDTRARLKQILAPEAKGKRGGKEAVKQAFRQPTLILSTEIFRNDHELLDLEFVYNVIRASFVSEENSQKEQQQYFAPNYAEGEFKVRGAETFKYKTDYPTCLFGGVLAEAKNYIVANKFMSRICLFCAKSKEYIEKDNMLAGEGYLLGAERMIRNFGLLPESKTESIGEQIGLLLDLYVVHIKRCLRDQNFKKAEKIMDTALACADNNKEIYRLSEYIKKLNSVAGKINKGKETFKNIDALFEDLSPAISEDINKAHELLLEILRLIDSAPLVGMEIKYGSQVIDYSVQIFNVYMAQKDFKRSEGILTEARKFINAHAENTEFSDLSEKINFCTEKLQKIEDMQKEFEDMFIKTKRHIKDTELREADALLSKMKKFMNKNHLFEISEDNIVRIITLHIDLALEYTLNKEYFKSNNCIKMTQKFRNEHKGIDFPEDISFVLGNIKLSNFTGSNRKSENIDLTMIKKKQKDPFAILLRIITEDKSFLNFTQNTYYQKLLKGILEMIRKFDPETAINDKHIKILIADPVILSLKNFELGFYSGVPKIQKEIKRLIGNGKKNNEKPKRIDKNRKRRTKKMNGAEAAKKPLYSPTLVLAGDVFLLENSLIHFEYMYYVFRSAFVGHKQTISETQQLFPANYAFGDFVENEYLHPSGRTLTVKYQKNNDSAIFEGLLGLLFEEIKKDRLSIRFAALCAKYIRLLNEEDFKEAEKYMVSAEKVIQNVKVAQIIEFSTEQIERIVKAYLSVVDKYLQINDLENASLILKKAGSFSSKYNNDEFTTILKSIKERADAIERLENLSKIGDMFNAYDSFFAETGNPDIDGAYKLLLEIHSMVENNSQGQDINNNNERIFNNYINLFAEYLDRGNKEKANEVLEKARSLKKEILDSQYIAENLSSMIGSYIALSREYIPADLSGETIDIGAEDFSEASKLTFKAYDIFKMYESTGKVEKGSLSAFEIMRAFCSLAKVYRKSQAPDFEKADHYLDMAFDLFGRYEELERNENEKLKPEELDTYYTAVEESLKAQLPGKTESEYRAIAENHIMNQKFDVRTSRETLKEISRGLIRLGNALIRNTELKQTETVLAKARNIIDNYYKYEEIKDEIPYILIEYMHLADVYLELYDFGSAEEILNKIYELFDISKDELINMYPENIDGEEGIDLERLIVWITGNLIAVGENNVKQENFEKTADILNKIQLLLTASNKLIVGERLKNDVILLYNSFIKSCVRKKQTEIAQGVQNIMRSYLHSFKIGLKPISIKKRKNVVSMETIQAIISQLREELGECSISDDMKNFERRNADSLTLIHDRRHNHTEGVRDVRKELLFAKIEFANSEKTTAGAIRQGDNAFEKMVQNLRAKKFKNIKNERQLQKDISDINERMIFGKEANHNILNSDEINIISTDAVAFNDNDFSFGFFSHKKDVKDRIIGILGDEDSFNIMFPKPTLVLSTEILLNLDPLIRQEYIYHESICFELGHYAAIGHQQTIFPENYTEGEFWVQEKTGIKYLLGTKKHKFKGKLGRIIRNEINILLTNSKVVRECQKNIKPILSKIYILFTRSFKQKSIKLHNDLEHYRDVDKAITDAALTDIAEKKGAVVLFSDLFGLRDDRTIPPLSTYLLCMKRKNKPIPFWVIARDEDEVKKIRAMGFEDAHFEIITDSDIKDFNGKYTDKLPEHDLIKTRIVAKRLRQNNIDRKNSAIILNPMNTKKIEKSQVEDVFKRLADTKECIIIIPEKPVDDYNAIYTDILIKHALKLMLDRDSLDRLVYLLPAIKKLFADTINDFNSIKHILFSA